MENRNLMILETEREQIEMRLKNQIASVRSTLNNLESKLENGDVIYVSDGLQGSGTNIDVYVSQLTSYDRAIELFNRQLARDK